MNETTWLMEIAVYDPKLAEKARELIAERDKLRDRATQAEMRLLSLGQPVEWLPINLEEELARR